MREKLFSIGPDDFEVTWFSGTGAGEQYRNKHQNCCRIKHKETGVIGTGQSNRNQEANKKEAFMNVYNNPTFQLYLQRRINEALSEESIDDIVDREMRNVKVEVREDGKWVEEKEWQ